MSASRQVGESGPALAVQPVIDAPLLGQATDLDAIDAVVDAKRHELGEACAICAACSRRCIATSPSWLPWPCVVRTSAHGGDPAWPEGAGFRASHRLCRYRFGPAVPREALNDVLGGYLTRVLADERTLL